MAKLTANAPRSEPARASRGHRPQIKVYVAGRPARELGTPVAPGDALHILQSLSGG